MVLLEIEYLSTISQKDFLEALFIGIWNFTNKRLSSKKNMISLKKINNKNGFPVSQLIAQKVPRPRALFKIPGNRS